jgi:catechol 2,3-dioxygenase
MESPPTIRPVLSHMGIYVHDMDAMEDFYTRVMGLVVTERGKAFRFPIDLVFLSSRPEVHHQLALASGRPEYATYSVINQMSFAVESLDELREMSRRVTAEAVRELVGINHGNAWSLYFLDPEGNRVEVYLDSPWHVPQPHGDDLDLEMSNDDIMSTTLDTIRNDAGFMPREQFEAEMQRKLDA